LITLVLKIALVLYLDYLEIPISLKESMHLYPEIAYSRREKLHFFIEPARQAAYEETKFL